jgi:hypothetical protein
MDNKVLAMPPHLPLSLPIFHTWNTPSVKITAVQDNIKI